jgi:hypothetical protein
MAQTSRFNSFGLVLLFATTLSHPAVVNIRPGLV